MARVQWRRARFDTVAHAVIEGDVLVLCGAMTRKGPRPAEDFGHIVAAEAVPGMACPYCREIITEAAEALAGPVPVSRAAVSVDYVEHLFCSCGHVVASHCTEPQVSDCRSGGGCHACECSKGHATALGEAYAEMLGADGESLNV